jgi:preprotein translocase subunit Sec63
MDRDDEKNAYEVVGVGSDATEADIKRAFRQRSLKTHPDRVRTTSSSRPCSLTTYIPMCRTLTLKMQVRVYLPLNQPDIESDHSLITYSSSLS